MRIDRLTNQLQVALSDAQSIALGQDHSQLDPGHLLLAMIDQKGAASVRLLLSQAGFDVAGLRTSLNEYLENLPQIKNPTGEVTMSPDMVRLLNLADRHAQKVGDKFVSSDSVLLVLMLESQGAVSELLKKFGNAQRLQQAIQKVRGGENVDDADSEGNRQALEKYTVDLTARAEAGKLDPVIGRDDEIRRTIQV
ncbi:MAG TPA: Clp protease N-terminal domain-containing protein, partial [Cellvibrio sp.]|nr:Clp protease N-terminal domain-containing protein [Cellvibrio sp.]